MIMIIMIMIMMIMIMMELVRYANWAPDTRDGLFWRDGTLSGSGDISGDEDKWCEVRSIR